MRLFWFQPWTGRLEEAASSANPLLSEWADGQLALLDAWEAFEDACEALARAERSRP